MSNGKEIREQMIKRTERYAEAVRKQYIQAVNAVLAMPLKHPNIANGEMYSFDGDSAKIRAQVEDVLKQLSAAVMLTVTKGIEAEWNEANADVDKVVNGMVGALARDERMRQNIVGWYGRNRDAMQAFIERSDKGVDLSKRVWQYSRQLRDEMEVAITVAIAEGKSAGTMSRAIRQYLNDPDLMFRRFRYKAGEKEIKDENGNVVGTETIWGRKWKKRIIDPVTGRRKWIDYDRDSYVPKGAGRNSRGVYKSSYKNAMRVARSETNMAYRAADHERWKSLDFVRGVNVRTSAQHPCNDICDTLAGDYPREFHFCGWHPQCFCIATPILAKREEVVQMLKAKRDGKPFDWSTPQVGALPQNYTDWVDENKGRITKARTRGTLPYFLKWNEGKQYGVGAPVPTKVKTPQEIAKERHASRTQEQIDDIKRRYWMRWEADYFTEDEKLARVNSFLKLEKELKIKRGKPMTYNQANKGKENPHYRESNLYRDGYGINCQTCTMAHLLRRLGFDVSAMPNKLYKIYDKRTNKKIKSIETTYAYLNKIGVNWMERFVDAKTGMGVTYSWSSRWKYKKGISRFTNKVKMDFINENTLEDGIYEIYCGWKEEGAHVFCAERINGKLRLFDPQPGKDNVLDYVTYMDGASIGVARIDNAIVNPKIGVKLFAR